MSKLFKKRILITGGSGSWGNELTKQILTHHEPEEIRIYSRGEIRQWEMKKKFGNHPKLKFIIGDVRDLESLKRALKDIDFVFNLAALKHVPICEENPNETVLTNLIGAQNIISSAIENDVGMVVQVSTDKAVDPLNLYGLTKSCAERLMVAANNAAKKTRFVCIRGGNVLGTNGSIVPLVRDQIILKKKITLTDERMTRFFLNLSDAIKLIFRSVEDAAGGEIFVMKMPAMKITDLLEVMVEHLSNGEPVTIEKIGIRPGEKIHEVLVSKYDSGRVIEDGDFYIILPLIHIIGLKEKYSGKNFLEDTEFSSEKAYRLSKNEIIEMLKKEGWLDKTDGPELSSFEVKRSIDVPRGLHHV